MISYYRGFVEGRGEYAHTGACRKCHRNLPLRNNGLCDLCSRRKVPEFFNFRDMELASLIDEGDIERGRVKMPMVEKLPYRDGVKSGYNKRFLDGYENAKRDFHVTYPCRLCGKPMTLKPRSETHKEVVEYLSESGWKHVICN